MTTVVDVRTSASLRAHRTRLVQRFGDGYSALLEQHHSIVRSAMAGWLFLERARGVHPNGTPGDWY